MYLTITNLGHCGHMTWYIWNILDNIPSQDVLVTSVWYILNVLNICWFGTVLVLRPRPYNVLAMYQVGTSPLAPSARRSTFRRSQSIFILEVSRRPKRWTMVFSRPAMVFP